ncbi:MAG: nuclear transport factor 2 family protein [Ferrovibrio sp.]|uniref:nuclear transport factor 2 family protein n=1 Tax=Ferrovibrio sp. TaxID=1917215 RepID=UPI002607399A|nr:nuclear transport factor 2 family protein [Ferrovibrio sp.]MCW0236723.1 nuclear transport factor 2 family protein [Ferrovibrio sp.]
MPSRETVEAFVAMVESNQHDLAIEHFYTEDASMQENLTEPPRRGRDTLVAHERAVLARAKTVRTECIRPVLIDGDTVVVHWVFHFEFKDGSKRRIEELAHQTWQGEKVWRERFYYDPAQMKTNLA